MSRATAVAPRAKVLLVAGAAALAVAVGILGVRSIGDRALGFNREFDTSFAKVRLGMSEADVLQLLGTPLEESDQFYLGQREGFEAEYARAAASGAKRFLIWRNGVDVVYAVGLDDSGAVVVASYGGT